MRKALVTLSGAGIIASFILASCVVKEESDDDGDGGSNGSAKGGAPASSTTKPIVPATGGAQNTNPTAPNGGAPVSSTVGGTKEPACPDLLQKLSSGSDVCSATETAADYSHINMLIVLDKSLSMTATPAGDTKTKWVGATEALQQALNPNEPLVSYGFILYPYAAPVAATSCELSGGEEAVNVKIGAASESVPKIVQLMKDTTPGGGTPTASALRAAFQYYTQGGGMALDGQKYVLLVTDGGPNCNAALSCQTDTCTADLDKSGSCGDPTKMDTSCCNPINKVPGGVDPQALCLDHEAVKDQLNALRGQGIKTFVIGIPGTEAYASFLDGFADAGGVPVTPTTEKPHRYYEVKNQAELLTAFKTITTSLVRDCNVKLAEKPLDLSKINVAVDCAELPQKTGEVVNWEYLSATQSIEIKGAKCEAIKSVGAKRIDVVNGCPTIIQL
ncbi:MAG: vWA domain-containing protein [Myxococcales bacterium]